MSVRNVRRLLCAGLLILTAWAVLTAPAQAAGGGRVHPKPCAASKTQAKRVTCLVKAVEWERSKVALRDRQLTIKWEPVVHDAVLMASLYSGYSFTRLWTISGCESTHNPFNVTGQYKGLFQLGDYHQGQPDMKPFSVFNPYANAFHAAFFMERHGESQWACRSDGSVAY